MIIEGVGSDERAGCSRGSSLGLRSWICDAILYFRLDYKTFPKVYGGMMSQIDDLFTRAQEMPPDDRAALAHRLLLSLEANDFDADSGAAWAAELEARLARIEQGDFQARDWRESLAGVRQHRRE